MAVSSFPTDDAAGEKEEKPSDVRRSDPPPSFDAESIAEIESIWEEDAKLLVVRCAWLSAALTNTFPLLHTGEAMLRRQRSFQPLFVTRKKRTPFYGRVDKRGTMVCGFMETKDNMMRMGVRCEV